MQSDNGRFDLALDDGAADTAVRTLIYAVLFTDAKAPADRAQDYDRRGWWAQPEAVTGLWYVRRQPLSASARREALGMIKTALTAHGLTDLVVSEVEPDQRAGTVSSLIVEISGSHNGRRFVLRTPLP
jgi:phage gp46-like protein